MGKIQRRAVFGPKPHIALVGANQQAFALLAQVIFAVAIRHRWQAAIQPLDLGDGLGHEILVFGGLQGQRDARQRSHLAPPKTGCVDHPRRGDIALWRAHDPCAIGLGLGGCNGGKAMNFSPTLARAHGIGIGHTAGVNIAAFGFEHDAADAIVIHQRVQLFGLVAGDFVKIHPV